MAKVNQKNILIALLTIGLIAFLCVEFQKRNPSGQPEVFYKQNMLESLWYHYKIDMLEKGTLRPLDRSRGQITTSEGTSYSMLRSVWMNDKVTFDGTWKWVKNNIARKDDHLFSWLFGQRPDGTYGVINENGGINTATDADSDIALSLLFASKRWNDDSYRFQADLIIKDIWEKEVVMIKGRPYLVANNAEKTDLKKSTYILNPSYLSPYAYRIFADEDKTHPWLNLVDTSYEVLFAVSDSPFNKETSSKLPPDWIEIDKNTGAIYTPKNTTLTTNFSYDALRTPWRIELDRRWFGEPRADQYLRKLSFMDTEWQKNGALFTNYTHEGTVVDKIESPSMYGGTIAYFALTNPEEAHKIYLTKLESLYNLDTLNWKTDLGYYDSNWAWFGIALYNNLLPNLYSLKTN